MGRRPRTRRPSLDEVLEYRNREVVDRFCNERYVPRKEANAIFIDMLRYLWLAWELAIEDRETIAPVPVVDEMWHTFLMFTVDYTKWTEATFGRFLHHAPLTSAEKRETLRLYRVSPERARHGQATRLGHDITAVFDRLGERVTLRWYVSYARRFPATWLKRRRPPAIPTIRFPPALLRRVRS